MTDDRLSDAVKDAQQNSHLENARQSYNGLKQTVGMSRVSAAGIDLVFVVIGGYICSTTTGAAFLAGLIIAGMGVLGLAMKAWAVGA